jgi:sugar transferase (PEP-CTERM/EpsH1 system associated)
VRILFTTARFPFPPMRGDRVVPYHRIKYLSRRHAVSLLSFLESPKDREYIPEMAPYCAEIGTVVLPKWLACWNVATQACRGLPLQVLYYRSFQFRKKLHDLIARRPFDIVHTVLSRIAEHTMGLQNVVKIMDMVDALSLTMERRARFEKGFMSWLYRHEAARMRSFEKRVCSDFDHVIVVSEVDRQHLAAPNVSVIPSGVTLEQRPRLPEHGRKTVIFTGFFAYYPNQDAACFLMREILPALRREIAGVRVKIAGADPSREMLRLARASPDVEVTGYVPDLAEHILRADVAVCPLRTGGAGLHLKVLEAMACGTPVVASPLVTGLPARPGEDILFASGVPQYVQAIKQVLGNPEVAQRLSRNGRKLVAEKFNWEASTCQLEQLYEDLLERAAGHRVT